jgi:hypothetical protein
MPSSTPDWSALASENERVVVRCPAALEVVAVTSAAPDDEPEPEQGHSAAGRSGPGHPAPGRAASGGFRHRHHAPERRPLWRARAARAAAVGAAAAAAIAGTAGPSAAA